MASEGKPRLGRDGQIIGYAGSMRDVTEQKRAESRLHESNQQLAREVLDRTRTEEEVRSLSARLLTAREEERSRLATELHDDLNPADRSSGHRDRKC